MKRKPFDPSAIGSVTELTSDMLALSSQGEIALFRELRRIAREAPEQPPIESLAKFVRALRTQPHFQQADSKQRLADLLLKLEANQEKLRPEERKTRKELSRLVLDGEDQRKLRSMISFNTVTLLVFGGIASISSLYLHQKAKHHGKESAVHVAQADMMQREAERHLDRIMPVEQVSRDRWESQLVAIRDQMYNGEYLNSDVTRSYMDAQIKNIKDAFSEEAQHRQSAEKNHQEANGAYTAHGATMVLALVSFMLAAYEGVAICRFNRARDRELAEQMLKHAFGNAFADREAAVSMSR